MVTKAMFNWRSVVRAVAVLFLLMVAVEVFACDLLPSPSCELSNPVGDSGQNPSSDECFCCCHHVVAANPPVTLAPAESVETVVPTVESAVLESHSPAIDQPPRALTPSRLLFPI